MRTTATITTNRHASDGNRTSERFFVQTTSIRSIRAVRESIQHFRCLVKKILNLCPTFADILGARSGTRVFSGAFHFLSSTFWIGLVIGIVFERPWAARARLTSGFLHMIYDALCAFTISRRGPELREAKKMSGSTYRFHQALPWENKNERRKARSKQSTVP